MSGRLESLIADARAGARNEHRAFDVSRSFGAALVKKERRERRECIVRRSLITLSGGAFFALLLIRASSAPASASVGMESTPSSPVVEAPPQELAARALDDGGFARD